MRWTRAPYQSRVAAGQILGDELAGRVPAGRAVVLGLPRGGVPVAAQVARRLGAPLDVLTVRKVGAPGHVELAIGAVASGDLVVRNEELVTLLGLTDDDVARRVAVARRELDAQDDHLRRGRSPVVLTGAVVILVDDGLATGATMRVAIATVRAADPAHVVVAVPVGPPETVGALAALADDVVCLRQPADFTAVGQWYRDFGATSDAEVIALLRGA